MALVLTTPDPVCVRGTPVCVRDTPVCGRDTKYWGHKMRWKVSRWSVVSRASRHGLLGLVAGLCLTGAAAVIAPAVAQVFTQMQCRIVIERHDGEVSAFSVIQADKPTRADYTLSVLKIDAAGSGVVEQTGSHDLGVNETVTTSKSTFSLNPDGWIEFRLKVVERLTGAVCEAKEIVSPM